MKIHINNHFLPAALTAGFGFIMADRVAAQTFTTLHSFSALTAGAYTNSDGAGPMAGLILSGNALYGTAARGGTQDFGTVFALNTDGSGFATLHAFTNNGGGGYPLAGVILSDNTLYGSMNEGGLYDKGGGVFAVNIDGTGFTNLQLFTNGSFNIQGFFTNSGGAAPLELVLSGATLYGTTITGGKAGYGTVFSVATGGTGFTNLHVFAAGALNASHITTNSDGFFPQAGLILSGGTLYGTTELGGSPGYGTVFAVNTNGTGFRIVYSFTNGSDGAWPYDELLLSGNTLYGTASAGGNSGSGTVFAVQTNGSGFTTLHRFTATLGAPETDGGTNSDGADPNAGLILSGNTLYGTAYYGGPSGNGTVFAVHTDGTGFTNVYSFSALPPYPGGSAPPSTNGDGAHPNAGLILSGNTLYGTAYEGGVSGEGTVFSLSLPATPSVTTPKGPTIIISGAEIILTYPVYAAGSTLQACSDLSSGNWVPLQTLVASNGLCSFSEPLQMDCPARFYRISSQ
jgi:uncharacterized repeat protein (TIGR03803 family)